MCTIIVVCVYFLSPRVFYAISGGEDGRFVENAEIAAALLRKYNMDNAIIIYYRVQFIVGRAADGRKKNLTQDVRPIT